jgi:hypothetical protein
VTPWPLSVLTEVEQLLNAPRSTIAARQENRIVRMMVSLFISISQRNGKLSVSQGKSAPVKLLR